MQLKALTEMATGQVLASRAWGCGMLEYSHWYHMLMLQKPDFHIFKPLRPELCSSPVMGLCDRVQELTLQVYGRQDSSSPTKFVKSAVL